MAAKITPYADFLFPVHTEKPELFKQFSAESIMVEEEKEYRRKKNDKH